MLVGMLGRAAGVFAAMQQLRAVCLDLGRAVVRGIAAPAVGQAGRRLHPALRATADAPVNADKLHLPDVLPQLRPAHQAPPPGKPILTGQIACYLRA
jgi:hypothetical protein